MPPRSQRGGSRPARGNDVCASTLLVQHTEKPTDGAEADARTVTVLLCVWCPPGCHKDLHRLAATAPALPLRHRRQTRGRATSTRHKERLPAG